MKKEMLIVLILFVIFLSEIAHTKCYDVDDDGDVDIVDIMIVTNQYETEVYDENYAYDFNHDGYVNEKDIEIVIKAFDTTVNDTPAIVPQSYIITEFLPDKSFLYRVLACSPENQEMIYTLTDGNTDEAFSISPTTGDLWINNPLDYKMGPKSYTLTVQVETVNHLKNSSTVSISLNTPPSISWTASSQSIDESSTSIGVTAQLSSVSTAYDITIPLTITGTAERLTDYGLSTKSIFIPAGSQSATITITIYDDLWVEDDETIEIKMEPTGNYVIETPDLHIITIQNDDYGYFSTPVKQTNSFVKFLGDVFTINDIQMSKGDEIAVFDPDGVLCGRVIIDDNMEIYELTVYGDAPSTIEIDEGARVNDVLTFKIWDMSCNNEQIISSEMFFPSSLFGNIPACTTQHPKWTGNNDIWGLNFNILSDQFIPLHQGWNLFSFSVNKVYYESETPPDVPTLSNAVFEKVTSLNDVLLSIDGKYDKIRNYDINGEQTFYSNAPPYSNTLHYMASGYGYWIKMNEPGVLRLSGVRAKPSDTLSLHEGWNLIGYWHTDMHYDSKTPPSVDLSCQVIATQVSELNKVFDLIDGKYSNIRSFDINGGSVFFPDVPIFFNTLHYMAPGYGYFIKTTEDTEFAYDFELPAITSIEPQNVKNSGDRIQINGNNFHTHATITVDGLTPTNITWLSETLITCDLPPHPDGQVELILTNPFGKSDSYILTYVYYPPIAYSNTVTTSEDIPVNISLAGESPASLPLTFEIKNQPSNGILSQNPPYLTYTPNPHFYGTDTFLFIANDGVSDSDPATISITVDRSSHYDLKLVGNGYGTFNIQSDTITASGIMLPYTVSVQADEKLCIEVCPDSDFRLIHWAEDLQGTANLACITMDRNKTISANMILKTFELNIQGNEPITINNEQHHLPCSLLFDIHTPIILESASYRFNCWEEEDNQNYQNTYQFTIHSDMTITANFHPEPDWQTEFHVDRWVDNKYIFQHNSVFLGVSPQAYSNSTTVLSDNNSCDIIMINNQSSGALKRNIQQNTYDTYQWIILVDPRGTIGETYVQKTATLSWDASTFSSEGKYVLKNEAGEIVVSDMRTTTEYQVSGTSYTSFTIIWQRREIFEFHLNKGWNLISLPVSPDTKELKQLFPDYESAYEYKKGAYIPVTTIIPGKGYWLKIPFQRAYLISGKSLPAYTIDLSKGLHLVGWPFEKNALDKSISNICCYVNGKCEQVFSLVPGFGYWIKIE
ncbi:MAG: IPT/TIG domain-containing protein [Candidatus Magnetomorum sp.]|nr:IPT/TIG domain-containing protein [Candidatus Magnetomorum sp.]